MWLVACAGSLLACATAGSVGGDGAAQQQAARERAWAAYGGKRGAPCREPPATLFFDVSVNEGAEPTHAIGRNGISSADFARIRAAVETYAPALVACVNKPAEPAFVEAIPPRLGGQVSVVRHTLAASEVACLMEQLSGALEEVGTGQLEHMFLRFGRQGYHFEGAGAPTASEMGSGLSGSLSKQVIAEVIRSRNDEVRACYEDGLSGWPQLKGRVIVKFIIRPNGSVGTTRISSTSLQNGPVECCISAAVRRLRFPAPQGGGIVVVNYPFLLRQR